MDTVENVFTYESEIQNVQGNSRIINYAENEYVMVSEFSGGLGISFGIVKVNSNGEVLSSFYDENMLYGQFLDLSKASDEGFYVLTKLELLKFNSENELIWEYNFSEWATNTNKYFYVHPSGNISVTGGSDLVFLFDSDGNSYDDVYVSGTGGLKNHIGTNDGGFLFNDGYTIYKTDENGEINWELVHDVFYIYGFIETDNNEYIIYGHDWCTEFEGNCTNILKINNQGELIWSEIYNEMSGGTDYGNRAILQINGGYIFGGSKSLTGGTRSTLLRINEDGDELWQYESDNSSNTNSYISGLVNLSENRIFAVGHHTPSNVRYLTIFDYHYEYYPPSIDEIPNQEINEDEPITININATGGSELTFYAESDTSAMPVYMDDTELLILLQSNWHGIGNITVVVTDENDLSDTTAFTVTVLPVNDSPEEFDLIFPSISDTLFINTDTNDAYSFYWETSEDVDSDVTYNMTITLDYFGDTYSETYESNNSLVSVSGYEWSALMTNLNLQRWTLEYFVTASDEEYNIESEVGEFVFENTSLSIDEILTPLSFSLHQNYPNPFNPITTLRYELPVDGLVNITVYDMLGNVVNQLVNEVQNSGYKSIQWNATNNQGESVSAGVYLYSIKAGDFRQTKKMILLK